MTVDRMHRTHPFQPMIDTASPAEFTLGLNSGPRGPAAASRPLQ
jgi:hypothetical protein